MKIKMKQHEFVALYNTNIINIIDEMIKKREK